MSIETYAAAYAADQLITKIFDLIESTQETK
jgi:hypothetical protein